MSALEAMLVAQDAAAQGSLPDPTAHLELAGFAFPPSAGPSGEHRFLAHLKVGGEETECCGMVWQPAPRAWPPARTSRGDACRSGEDKRLEV